MSKKITYELGLIVPAQTVTAGPPIGTTLGPKGVALGLFVKAVNEATTEYDKGAPVGVLLKIFEDKSFEFKIIGYTTRYLIMKYAGVTKGSSKPGRESQGSITRAHVEAIAKLKLGQMNTEDLKSIMRTVEGTAKSSGIEIKG